MAGYSRTITGAVTPGGSVPTLSATRYLSNQASQVLTFAGALTRTRQRVVSGVLSFAGVSRRISSDVGSLLWNDLFLLGRVLASLGGEGGSYRRGSTEPSGAPSTVKIVRYLANQASQVLSFSGRVLTGSVGEEGSDRKGTLWITGYLRDMVSTVKRTGTLTTSGIVAAYQSGGTAIAKSVSGALNLAGSIYEILIQVQHELYKNVELTFSSTLRKLREPKRTISGTLTFEKYCTWQWSPYTGIQYVRTKIGTVTLAGALSYLRGIFKSGTLTITGLLTRSSSVFKSVGSVFLSPAGTVVGSWAPLGRLGGILSFAGAISSRVPFKGFAGAVAMSGSLRRTFTITRRQTGTLTALNEIERTKELLYYGIINP